MGRWVTVGVRRTGVGVATSNAAHGRAMYPRGESPGTAGRSMEARLAVCTQGAHTAGLLQGCAGQRGPRPGGRRLRVRRQAAPPATVCEQLEPGRPSLGVSGGRAYQGPCECTILIEINSILIIFYTIMILKFECDQFTINLVLRRLNRH